MKIIHFLYKRSQIEIIHLIYIVFVIMRNRRVKLKKKKIFSLFIFVFFYCSGTKISHETYLEAERELREDANTHYHTVIGRATIYEIIATVLILIDTGLTLWLGLLARREDKI